MLLKHGKLLEGLSKGIIRSLKKKGISKGSLDCALLVSFQCSEA